MASPNRSFDVLERRANSTVFSTRGYYVPLLVPFILFLVSLYIPPTINADSSEGFRVLRSMLEGGPFNSFTSPDPANIANDVVTFQTLWSPGQYLVPGVFIWLGTSYGLALSLTALIATLIGVLGWLQLARSFAVSSFVLLLLALGLSTFSYVTLPFRIYNGGELLLFAAGPWSLYLMRRATNQGPIFCFAVSLLSFALLFLAKLTGLMVFAANVGALTLFALDQRRLSSSTIAMWVASAIGALCFMMFWLAHGPVAARGATFDFSWFPIWFSVTGATFSGTSALDFLSGFLGHTLVRILSYSTEWSDLYTRMLLLSCVLGPMGLLLIVWAWLRLRHTRYREMAVLLLTAILLYTIPLAVMFLRGAPVSIEDRHFRYAGILFFLLLLTAIDQWRIPLAKVFAWVVVIVLGFYGLYSFVSGSYVQIRRANYYDPMSGIYQEIVSPAILEYMRSEVTRHNVQHPIAVVPSLLAAMSLPRFRILYIIPYRKMIEARTWAGHAEKIFVIVPEEILGNGMAENILRSFTGYEFHNWRQTKLDGMIVYSQ